MIKMYDRFTSDARKVMEYSRESANGLCANDIDVDDGLMTMIIQPPIIQAPEAGKVLRSLKVSPAKIQKGLSESAHRKSRVDSNRFEYGQLPFSPAYKRALEYAEGLSRALGHGFIDSHHLLYGIVRQGEEDREREGITAVLEAVGLKAEEVRDKIAEMDTANS